MGHGFIGYKGKQDAGGHKYHQEVLYGKVDAMRKRADKHRSAFSRH